MTLAAGVKLGPYEVVCALGYRGKFSWRRAARGRWTPRQTDGFWPRYGRSRKFLRRLLWC